MTTTAPAPGTLFRFSLDEFPDRDRPEMMLDYFCRHMRRIDVRRTNPDEPLKCATEVRIIPGASWGIAQMSKVSAHRTRQLLEDGCDDIMLFAPSHAITVSPQGGSDLDIVPGSALLMSQARAAVTTYHGPAETFAFRFPRAQLARLVPSLGEASCAELRRDTPGLDLLFRFGRLLHAEPLVEPELQAQMARQLQDLAALVIGANRDLAEDLKQTSIAEARLATIKADVRENVGRKDVSVAAVAARHGITARYIHLLFEGEGRTFGAFATAERLAEAHRLLTDKRQMHRRISEIAFAVGFHDLSTFNRQFRRHYGATPSDVREAALRSSNPSSP